MKAFQNIDAKSVKQAVTLLQKFQQEKKSAIVVGGGSEILQLMKERVITPDYIVNLKTIPGLRARRLSHRRFDDSFRNRRTSGGESEAIDSFRRGGRGGFATDPQRRNHRRQHLPAALLLVFPLCEFQLSKKGRPGLLHGDRGWPLSRHPGRRTELHRSSFGYSPSARRA